MSNDFNAGVHFCWQAEPRQVDNARVALGRVLGEVENCTVTIYSKDIIYAES